MNERNELHVRLAFSCTGSLWSPFWDYKGRARKLILLELPRSGSSATSLKDIILEHELSFTWTLQDAFYLLEMKWNVCILVHEKKEFFWENTFMQSHEIELKF